MNTNTSKKTFLLVEGALMIAMAFVLSYIKLYDMPMGGSITLEMIPLVIMGLRHGVNGELLRQPYMASFSLY